MKTLAIEGMQWGDEGKGKITDYCASRADIVVRSQGGNNAGHSIQHGTTRFALKLLPSGILNPEVTNVLADGVVINPQALLNEMENIKKQGVTSFKLLISKKATMLLPYHIELDKAREEALGDAKIGTTKNGIGPCYEDRAARTAIRMGDLLDLEYLKKRLHQVLALKNIELKAYGASEINEEELYNSLVSYAALLKDMITDTNRFLYDALMDGKKILFEGAQGAMLDLSHGTYPYVTSSSPLATAIPTNCGLPLDSVNDIIGILKAYTTRVGEGPFPSEIQGELASTIREVGHEYGTVTKRPRRIGWLDIPQITYVREISGVKRVSLMLLDVLSSVDEIKICTEYHIDGKKINYMPSTVEELSKVEPVFITLPSWKCDISKARTYDELPNECKKYIETVEQLAHISCDVISVGAEKDQTIIRKEIF